MSNASISSSTRFGSALNLGTTTGTEQVVALGDVNGNLIRTSDDGASGGTSFLGGAVTLIALQSAAYTAANSPATCATDGITYGALDMTVTSFTGGTTPTVTFFFERLAADGVWYQILTTGAINAATTISVDISPALTGSYSGPPSSTQQHAVFTKQARLRWTFGGSPAPTAVTFSASFIGR